MSLEIVVETQVSDLGSVAVQVWRRRDLMMFLQQQGWSEEQLEDLDFHLNTGYAADHGTEYRTFQVGDRRDKISIPRAQKKPRAN